MMKTILWVNAIVLLLLLSGCNSRVHKEEAKVQEKRKSRTVNTESVDDIKNLFNDINYSLENWNKGRREIPRLYITDISSRWEKQSQSIPVRTKKAIFFQLTIPLILRSNELLIAEREKLITLVEKQDELNAEEKEWLRTMAERYKLLKSGEERVDRQKMNELLLRLNIIPPSLALAQAAEESGWGTSRFAMLGNSLFGQWDFSGKGMAPAQQRKELGNYGLARFETPLEAVQSYMLNLNTHSAYRRLREKRAELHTSGKKINGYELAETLDRYSERRYAYVESLHKMMRYNHLGQADYAYLWDKETIYLTPLPDDPKPETGKSVKPAACEVKMDQNQSVQTETNSSATVNIPAEPEKDSSDIVWECG
jgi:Bax protein